MRPEAKKYLADVREAIAAIEQFTTGEDQDSYLSQPLLRSAVERQLMIVGEAISQLAKLDPGLTESIPEYQRIIAFRNILAHGYSAVDDATVWDVVDTKLSQLKECVTDLLAE